MTSKAARRRNKKKLKQDQVKVYPSDRTQVSAPVRRERSVMPTQQRMSRGTWELPDRNQGGAPVDLASDMIGRLDVEGKLTRGQVNAARQFQDMRSLYVGELGCQKYGSFLADVGGHYDSGDGNPTTIAAYREMEGRIGRVAAAVLEIETQKGPEDRPRDLPVLRNALDVFSYGA